MDQLDEKALAYFEGRVVQKSLANSLKGQINVLEGCKNVLECESRLATHLKDYCRNQTQKPFLLHEIPLTQPDVELIEFLIKGLIKEVPQGWSRFIVKRAPLFSALFLVWQGITGYRDGTYWPAVREITGVESRADEEMFGAAFLRVLRDYGLTADTDPESHRYVSPILFHAGIPDSCLPEFFREVVWRRFVGRDLVTKHAVSLELQRLRDERERALQSEARRKFEHLLAERRKLLAHQSLIERYGQLNKELAEIQEKHQHITRLLDIEAHIEQLKTQKRELLNDTYRPVDVEEDSTDKVRMLIDSETLLRMIQAQLQAVESELALLLKDHAQLRQQMAAVGKGLGVSDWERALYERLIRLDAPGESWFWLRLTVLAFESVQEMTGDTVPSGGKWLGEARELLREREAILLRWNTTKKDLLALMRDIRGRCPVQLVGPVAGLKDGWDEFLGVTNVQALFADAWDSTVQWQELINEAKERRLRLEKAKERRTRIARQWAALEEELKYKRIQRNGLVERLKDCMDWDADTGQDRLRQTLNALTDKEAEFRRRLFLIEDKLADSPGRRVDKETVVAEAQAIQNALIDLSRAIRDLESRVPVPPLSSVDKPIQRFLYYGGRAAEKFVLHAVELIHAAIDGEPHKPARWPDEYRYERIWQIFCHWWQDEGRTLCMMGLRVPRPRILCWREYDKWTVGVETPADLWVRPDLVVLHNGQKLASRSRPEGCWLLLGLEGTVEIVGNEGVLVTLELETFWQKNQPCLVFRGWDDEESPLPVVRQVSPGSVLVIAPDNWEPDEAAEQVALSEPVALSGYLAYYCKAGGGNGKITFLLPGGERFSLDVGSHDFSLEGNPGWFDGLDDLGPIFGSAPLLVPGKRECWNTVGTVTRVYRQTRRREELVLRVTDCSPDGRLFVPVDPQSDFYWVVLYDQQRYEKEHLAFRYLPGLQAVRTIPEKAPVFPPSTGHGETVLEIVGDVPYSVVLDEDVKTAPRPPRYTGVPTGLRVSFPPDPRFDHILLRLKVAGGRPVPILVVFERVWWAIGAEGEELAEGAWTDRVLVLQRDWFRPTSDKVLWIRWAGEGARLCVVTRVYVGHGSESRRAYPVRQAGPVRLVKVLLYEFAALCERRDRVCLRLWIEGIGASEIGVLPGLGALKPPFLRGGETVANVAVAGDGPLYKAEALPAVVFHLRDRADVGEWAVAVGRAPAGGGPREWQVLTGLAGVRTGEQSGGALETVVDLASSGLLGAAPVGRYALRFRAPDGEVYDLKLTVIPEFVYQFEPAALLPEDLEGSSSVACTVVTAPDTRFTVKPPAVVKEAADEVLEFTVDPTVETVAGTFLFRNDPGGELCDLEMTITLPWVQWRLSGSGEEEADRWTSTFREIWVGDAFLTPLFVEVRLPPTRPWGSCLLVWVDGEPRVLVGQKQPEEHFRFILGDLNRLSRTREKAVCTLQLEVYDHRGRLVRQGALLALRYRWEVVDPSVHWVCPPGSVRPSWLVRWTDKGRAAGRWLELRKAWTPWEPGSLWKIPDGATQLMIPVEGQQLPAGPYLLRFGSAETGVKAAPEHAASIKTGTNSFFVFLDDGRPHIRDLSCVWEPQAPLVCGKVTNYPVGVAVLAFLLGITRGAAVVCRGTGEVGADGSFCIPVYREAPVPEADGRTGDAPGHGFHWLAVFASTSPLAYQVAILDCPAPLECPWPGGPENIKPVWTVALGGSQTPSEALGVKLCGLDGAVKGTVLAKHVSRQVLKCWLDGQDKVETVMTVYNQTKKLRLRELQGKAVLAELEQGAVCTDPNCPQRGQILSSQQVWDREHYPHCKQLELLYRPFKAELTLFWDIRPLLTRGRQRYPWARESYRVLLDSQTDPLPASVAVSDAGISAVEDLLAELVARELASAAALESGAEV
ncbi:MAG: hypothetical protein QME76_10615 [Bacillota bacterium]|nr:hypothetical protein [Bacillota bacterium]